MPVKKKIAKTISKIKSRIDERRNAGEAPPWLKQVAMLTGVLAALSGFLDMRATEITNDAIYQSNQAILAQTQASDAWEEYQSDSIKARIVETALATAEKLPADKQTSLTAEATDLRAREKSIRDLAADKTAERDTHLQHEQKSLQEKNLLDYAGFAAQMGIALASVAALVRWRMPFIAGATLGVLGLCLSGYALATHYNLLP